MTDDELLQRLSAARDRVRDCRARQRAIIDQQRAALIEIAALDDNPNLTQADRERLTVEIAHRALTSLERYGS